MLPNEVIRRQPPQGGRPQVNNLVDPKAGSAATADQPVPQSVLARPHSRQVVKSSRGKTTGSLFAATAPTGRTASPPRLKQDSSVMVATPPPARSRSPQQTVRTLGNAIVNPQTVFGSGVERSTQVHAVRSSSPNGPRPVPGSPSRGVHQSANSTVSLSAIHMQQGGGGLSLRPQDHEVEVYGMDALKVRYGTTQLDVVVGHNDHPNGLQVDGLCPEYIPAPDLRKLDLGIVVPHYGLDAMVKPRITLLGEPNVVLELPHVVEAAMRIAAPITMDRFVALVVSIDENGLDRAVSYRVSTDVPELFTMQPTIDADSGTLHFAPNPLASGTSKCHVRALDHAMVDADGNVATSDALSFTITVNRVKSGGAHQSTANGSSMDATGGTSAHSTHNNRVYLATQGDFAMTHSPQELLKMRLGSDEAGGTKHAGGEGGDVPAAPFEFPAANPHELRYADVVHVNNLWIAQHPTSSVSGDAMQPTLYRPCFDSPLTDWELIRMGKAAQERDRIVGERVAEDTRAELETKLSDRIRDEERKIGASNADLCPLLLRLAQVFMSYGSKRQGDAVETLERICRIRLSVLGIESFEDINSLALQLGSGNLGGSIVMNGSITSALSGGVLNNSLFAAAQAINMGDTDPNADETSASTATKENKKFEAFQQSMLLLTMYLKSVGRYRELLEFATYALTAATIVHGDSSVSYLRALTETAEAHLLLGSYKEASPIIAGCVARSEVLFGAHSPATLGLVHMYGICLSEEREYSKSIAQHDRALKSRVHDGKDQIAIAESQLLAAWARMQSGSESPTMQERVVEHLEHAIGILTGLDGKTLSGALSVARAGLLTLAARMCRMRGDDQRSAQLLSNASDQMAACRGFDSLEYATVSVAHAAQRLSRFCEGWTPKLTRAETNTAKGLEAQENNEVTKAIADLQLANTVLLSVLGVNHPYTTRCSVLLAEARMFRSPQQSATSVERGLMSVRSLLHPLHKDHVIVNHVAAVVHLMTRDNRAALLEAATAHATAVELSIAEHHLIELESTLLGAMCRCREPPAPALLSLLESRVKSVTFHFGETSDMVVTPLQNLAEAYYLAGDFSRAHHFLSRALKIADSVNFIFLLGNLLRPVAQLTVADVQERNRIARDRIHTQLALRFSEILFQIGAVFDAEGGCSEDAQSTYLQSLAAQEISGVVSGLSVVQILSSLASLLYSDGHYGDALAYAEKAHSILLENFPTLRAVLDSVSEILRVVLFQLRCNGYTLLRHPDSRHRFTTYV